MPTYKLHYFDAKARAETARILFKLADCPFEDVRIERSSWPSIKPNTQIGFVPFMEVDNVILSQSHAINRYIAKQFGYGGKTPLDEALVDMVAATVEDLYNGARAILLCTDEQQKPKLIEDYLKHVDTVLNNVEKLLGNNREGKGYFVGDSLTWADVHVYTTIDFCELITGAKVWDKYPKLKGLKERLEKEPKIAEHLRTRPTTRF